MIINNSKYFFYLIVLFILSLIVLSNPFLHFPYDAIAHLIAIDEIYHGETINSTSIQKERLLWHTIWANVFMLFHLDSTQLLLRAKIIHVVQITIAFFSIYYFSHVVIRNIFKNINQQTLQYLSLWSALIWISIFATFSVKYQLVWSLWYSVNYQITLALFWYITALTIVLFLEHTSIQKKLFFIFQIILLSMFILRVHSMEFLYYLMHMTVFSLIFIDKIYLILKKYFYIIIPIALVTVFTFNHYLSDKPKIFSYLSFDKFPSLYDNIMKEGLFLINGYNRAFASLNELMYFIVFLGIIFIFLLLWRAYRYKKNYTIHFRVLLFLLITSMFILIPLFQFSGGVFATITRMDVVHRFYYSSSLFVLIPIFSYYIFQKYKLRYIHLFIILSLILVTLLSKYNNILNHNYYKNIQSIKNSFNERKVGFNLSSKQIKEIGDILKKDMQNNITGKPILYYARADIAFVIKYIFHQNVYWEGRRRNPDYLKIYEKNKSPNHILFKAPKGFPSYIPYM